MVYIAKHIAFFMTKNGIIAQEDEPIYIFGAELVLNSLAALITMLAISFMLKQVLPMLVFVVFFKVLREMSGGYHASTYLRCYLCSICIFLAVICSHMWVSVNMKQFLFIPVILLADILLLFTAPSQSLVNPKTAAQLQKNRKKMILRLLLSNVLATVCWAKAYLGGLYFVIGCTLIAVAILSVINVIQYHYIIRRN